MTQRPEKAPVDLTDVVVMDASMDFYYQCLAGQEFRQGMCSDISWIVPRFAP